jgi:predicted RNA-binding protein YlxR (DUF448 family)
MCEAVASTIAENYMSKKDDELNDRMCIVTRERGEADELIRFVIGPDGTVVPDLKRQLPGRGCWVKAERALVDKAVAKKLFGRALKAEAKADPNLGLQVDRLLSSQLGGMMNMARKAAQFITGASKVDQAVRALAALAVFHATDAAPDGVRKIDQARKAASFLREDETPIPSFALFSESELEGLLGQNAFIHAAALAGQAGEGVVKRAIMLERYRGGDRSGAHGGASQPNQ